MSDTPTTQKSPARLKRVKRLKRIIATLFFIVVLTPLALCLYFGHVSGSLKKELNKAKEELNFYMEKFSEEQFEQDNQQDTPLSATVPDTPEEEPKEWKPSVIKPHDEAIEELTMSEEELYDGYRKVYLTFDDGPSANTENILAILNEYGVKATFFMVKHDDKDIERLYKRIAEEGHSIGMHSCTHVYQDLYKDREAFEADTQELRDFLYDVTGVESVVYRFPGGSNNRTTKADMREYGKALHDMGIEFFDWNVSSQDATAGGVSKEHIVNVVTSGVQRKTEAIILFHDLASKKTTVEALPEIIEYIQSLDNTVILPITKDTDAIQFISLDEE